jgi:hypothetical protein
VRKQTTSASQENIVQLSAIRRQKHIASSPYGPVRAGLTTLQRTDRDLQLTELLNSLESVVADLNSKSYTVLDTLIIAIQAARVALCDTTTERAGTNADGS